MSYEQDECELEPGDTLLAFTDGVTEWSNPAGEQFGLKRLLERFVKFRDLPPDEIASSIITDVREFSEFLPCGDDYTLFVIRYKGRPN